MKLILKSHASSVRSDLEDFQRANNIKPSRVEGIQHDGIRYILWYWVFE